MFFLCAGFLFILLVLLAKVVFNPGSFWLLRIMAKLFGPLMSLDAKGTLGHIITYGSNQFGNWARRIVDRKYTETPEQKQQRQLFLDAIQIWIGSNPTVRYAWLLSARDKHYAGFCAFRSAYLRYKGPFWSKYPWVPPFPGEPTIRFFNRHAYRSGDDIYIRFNTCLIRDYPFEKYEENILNFIPIERTWEAGVDIYHSNVKDSDDPSFEYLMSFTGGKTFYNFTYPAKQFIAVSVFDMHGKTLSLSWLNDWPGWS